MKDLLGILDLLNQWFQSCASLEKQKWVFNFSGKIETTGITLPKLRATANCVKLILEGYLYFNPFVPSTLFLYPLKTSETIRSHEILFYVLFAYGHYFFFSTGLFKSALSSYSLGKTRFLSFYVLVFRVSVSLAFNF